jgi:nucleotide-binding universal stress UspA family protein
MYKHLLIAFDGSELSDKAMRQGMELAKTIGAKVTALYVWMPWANIAVGEIAVMFPPEEYETNAVKGANTQLQRVAETAKQMGVACVTKNASDAQPYKAIIDTANAQGCDLIVMGSHGRKGLAGVLLGSVANKTLSHAHIPVLVYRE